jgi:2-oxoglutarate ferredoxin oxidoreductase subunit gamma
MSTRTEFRLSGSGGQGIITAGIILAEAAVAEGLNAIQSQSYGPEARGGSSRSEVVISREPIDYPKATSPNYLLCLTQEAFNSYALKSGPETQVLADASVDVSGLGREVVTVPIVEYAETHLKPLVGNIIALGFIAAYTGVVSREHAKAAMLARVPKGTEELNTKAIEAGFRFADEAKA